MWIDDWDGGIIKNNYIIHNTKSEVLNIVGISVEGGSRDVLITNNIIYNINGINFKVEESDAYLRENISISGNIFQEPIYSDYTINSIAMNGLMFDDNIYFNKANPSETLVIENIRYSFESWQVVLNDLTSTFREYSFPDPTKDIDTYQEFIGETASLDAFIQACRDQDRFNWDPRYNTQAINYWIKKGYNENVAETDETDILIKPKKLRIVQ